MNKQKVDIVLSTPLVFRKTIITNNYQKLVPIILFDKIIVNYCKLLFFQASEGGEGAEKN